MISSGSTLSVPVASTATCRSRPRQVGGSEVRLLPAVTRPSLTTTTPSGRSSETSWASSSASGLAEPVALTGPAISSLSAMAPLTLPIER